MINVIAVCDTVLTYFIYLYSTAIPVPNMYCVGKASHNPPKDLCRATHYYDDSWDGMLNMMLWLSAGPPQCWLLRWANASSKTNGRDLEINQMIML